MTFSNAKIYYRVPKLRLCGWSERKFEKEQDKICVQAKTGQFRLVNPDEIRSSGEKKNSGTYSEEKKSLVHVIDCYTGKPRLGC